MKQNSRQLLFLIGRLHLIGYAGLRIMPMQKSDKWEVLIGPRSLFSSFDGSYIPSDLRHRCIKYVETEEELPSPDRPILMLQELYLRSNAPVSFLGSMLGAPLPEQNAEARKRFGELIGHCHVYDDAYFHWYLSLCGRLAIEDSVLPIRPDKEADSKESDSTFRIAKFRADGTVDKHSWPPPPPGQCYSSGASNKTFEPNIATAQPRPADAPELLWPGGGNKRSDSRIDEWYDENR
jgi:hypothetical protein